MGRTDATPAVIAAFALLIVACAPDESSGVDTGRPGAEAELAHAECMRDHGIDWPDPEFVDRGWEVRVDESVDLESPAFKTAEESCEQVRQEAQPEADANPEDRAGLEAEMDQMLEFAACMRDEGLEFPDPVMDDSGNISGPAGPMDGDWDAFEAAKQTCEDQTGEPMP